MAIYTELKKGTIPHHSHQGAQLVCSQMFEMVELP